MTDIEIVNREAWDRHERILSLIQQWRLYTLELGKELYEMRETEGWQKIGEYENYSGYLDDHGIRRDFASHVTRVYEVYQLGLRIESTKLLDIGTYKLLAGAKHTTKETVDEILASASTQTLHKFRRWLKERFRPDKTDLPTVLSGTEYSGNGWRLIHGDIVDICKAMPAKSFDAIVTDPPYPGEYLPLFSSLAEQAVRLLVDGGVLVVMSGQTHLPEVYERLTQYENLQYRWTVAYLMPGKTDVRVWGRTIWNRWKPVVVLTKGQPRGDWTIDVVTSPEADKQHHVWGQSLQGITGLIDAFVLPESRILDPFVGGGTTIDAAINMGHTCVGIDNDPTAIKETLNRLNGRLT